MGRGRGPIIPPRPLLSRPCTANGGFPFRGPHTQPVPTWHTNPAPPPRPCQGADVMRILRDHYEGTEFDLTQGLAAGPFNNPVRYSVGIQATRMHLPGGCPGLKGTCLLGLGAMQGFF